MKYLKIKSFFALLSLTLIGCGGGNSGSIDDTDAPVFITPTQLSIIENQKNIITVQANDNSEIGYSIINIRDSSKFSISRGGILQFRIPPDYEVPLDIGADNNYEVTIKATDIFNNSSEKNFFVTVIDINETLAVKDINITKDYQINSLGTNSRIHANIFIENSPKDVYILLSNYATSNADVRITKSNKSIASIPPVLNKQIVTKSTKIHAPAYVETFRKNMHKYMQRNRQNTAQFKAIETSKRKKDVALDTKRFYLSETQSTYTDATARKIVSNISTEFGDKTLNIWVSDDSFSLSDDSGCVKKKCVTQEMVDALASTFLQNGSDNDIYDWVSNVYGKEWGAHSEDALIAESNEITILLTDISNDNSVSGGVVGFFYPKDNLKQSEVSGSNQRIMLYADAVLFANGEDTWDIEDYWPREMMSTLAHEFQHVIHFYQKDVLQEVTSDVWINEMLSESVEDLVATKLKHTGPRGVEYTDGSAGMTGNREGRYSLFNETNTLSLTSWQNQLANYSHVNAFGTYLLRNYGGAKVLHDIVDNAHTDEKAVVYAVNKAINGSGKTFNDLLKEWGIAVLLSDNENLDTSLPTYNTGDFTPDTYNNSTYELGSINFFNYAPAPKVNNAAGTVEKQGNYYYKVGSNLSGNISIDLSLNGQTEATLITKESK